MISQEKLWMVNAYINGVLVTYAFDNQYKMSQYLTEWSNVSTQKGIDFSFTIHEEKEYQGHLLR